MTLFRYLLCIVALVSTAQVFAQVNRSSARVIIAPVSVEQQVSKVEAVGTAEAIRSVMIYPAVSDKVTAVHFNPGQYVEQGQLLLQLDARRQEVELQRVTIQLADAERTVTRLQQSQQRGAIAQSELDDAITLRNLLQVQRSAAQTELDDRMVRAPFAGVVGLTDIEQGDRIDVQTPITTLDDRKQLFVHFNAPESALPILYGNATVELEPWQSQGKRITADIAQIDSRIDPANRTIRTRALLDNQDDSYRPGMSFRVILQLKGQEFAVVPEAALLWGATGPYVWLEQQGKAEKVAVNIEQRLSGRLLVSGNLAKGDQLIIEGVQSLRAGQAVTNINSTGAQSESIVATK